MSMPMESVSSNPQSLAISTPQSLAITTSNPQSLAITTTSSSVISTSPSSAPGSSSPSSKPHKMKKTVLKTLKDPAAPKRPLSPYLVFAGEERKKVVAEMGNMAVGDMGKEMGRRWGLLDQQSKEEYVAAYQKDKARYEEEMKNYQPSQEFLQMKAKRMKKEAAKTTETGMEDYFSFLLSSWRKVSVENPNLGGKEVQEMIWLQWTRGEKGNKKVKKIKKAVDPAAPKKPLAAFFLFQKKMRKGGLVITGKAMADMWNNMDVEGKQVYKEEEEELRKVYTEEMNKLKSKKGGEGEGDA